MDRQIGIFLNHIHKHFTHTQSNNQLLLAFPNECLLLGSFWLYLAPYKLSQQTSCFVILALTNHKFVLIPDQGCYYFGHLFSPIL